MNEAAERMQAQCDAVKTRFKTAADAWTERKARADATGFPLDEDDEAPLYANQLIAIAPSDVVAVCDSVPVPKINQMVRDLRMGSKSVSHDPKVPVVLIRCDQAEMLLKLLG